MKEFLAKVHDVRVEGVEALSEEFNIAMKALQEVEAGAGDLKTSIEYNMQKAKCNVRKDSLTCRYQMNKFVPLLAPGGVGNKVAKAIGQALDGEVVSTVCTDAASFSENDIALLTDEQIGEESPLQVMRIFQEDLSAQITHKMSSSRAHILKNKWKGSLAACGRARSAPLQTNVLCSRDKKL